MDLILILLCVVGWVIFTCNAETVVEKSILAISKPIDGWILLIKHCFRPSVPDHPKQRITPSMLNAAEAFKSATKQSKDLKRALIKAFTEGGFPLSAKAHFNSAEPCIPGDRCSVIADTLANHLEHLIATEQYYERKKAQNERT